MDDVDSKAVVFIFCINLTTTLLWYKLLSMIQSRLCTLLFTILTPA